MLTGAYGPESFEPDGRETPYFQSDHASIVDHFGKNFEGQMHMVRISSLGQSSKQENANCFYPQLESQHHHHHKWLDALRHWSEWPVLDSTGHLPAKKPQCGRQNLVWQATYCLRYWFQQLQRAQSTE